MEITAFAKYDWKTIKKFNHFHNFKKNKLKRATVPILLFALAISLLGFAVCFFLDEFDSTLTTLLIIEVLLVLLLLFRWFIMPRINFNLNKIAKNNTNEYIFKDETFSVSCESNGMSGNSEIKYKNIRCFYETKEYIYVYINMNQAFIVEKDSISSENFEALRTHLLETMENKKYKIVLK